MDFRGRPEQQVLIRVRRVPNRYQWAQFIRIVIERTPSVNMGGTAEVDLDRLLSRNRGKGRFFILFYIDYDQNNKFL